MTRDDEEGSYELRDLTRYPEDEIGDKLYQSMLRGRSSCEPRAVDFAFLFQRRTDADAFAARLVGEEIEEDAQAVHQLTHNVLSWALAQKNVVAYNPAALSLRTEAEEVLALFQSVAAHKQITLRNDIPDHQEVYADKNTLHTILRNLLDNAIKFSHSGGAVSLSTTSSEEGVVIKIADTGTGIPQEKLRDIFLLQKGKNEQGTAGEKGAGLGLHLVWEMVQLNQGKIEMFSQPNQGTEVRLLLPAA